jgi:LysR family glycine cleavage system transcriptional activator
MHRRLPPLNSLRAFEVVSRHNSLRAAAKELHVTAAAVGQQVRALEDHLGHKLLRRHSDGYVLTPEAQAVAPDLRDAFERLAAVAARLSASARRTVTVTTTPSLASAWLIPRLQDFERRHADIDFLIHTSQQPVDLETSGVDVALRYGSGTYAGAESTPLFSGELFPVCSPQFISDHGSIKAPEDLRGKPLLHVEWQPPKGVWPDWSSWLKAAGVAGVDARKGLRFSDQALSIQAALAGRGVALASIALARDHLEARRLIRPFKVSVATEFGYFVVIARRRTSEPDIAAFKRWLLEQARRDR